MSEQIAPGRRRTNDPDGMRRRLLDVAAEAFQSRGYHSTGMHDIMRAAGVTGGALYHHFPTKKTLGLAVIRERVAKEVAEAWIEPVKSAPTVADGILGVFERIIAGLEARGAVSGCPLNNLALELSLADPDFRLAVQNIFENWRLAIAARIRADQAAGALTDLVPEAFATFVVASYSGAMALAKADQNAGPLKICAEQFARLFGDSEAGD